MSDHRGTLEPGVTALIDQSLQGAKDYIVEVRNELASFREKHPDVTTTELVYMMFDSLRLVLTTEQAMMTLVTLLIEDNEKR